MSSALGFFLYAVMTLTLSSPALSQTRSDRRRSADAVARELANPNTVLGTLSFPFDFVRYDGDLPGASDESSITMSFQPSLPVPLAEGLNFFARPLIPIALRQPVPTDTGFEEKAGLGDIVFDMAVGTDTERGLIAIAGIVGSLPTATDDAFGTGQFLLGPEVVVGYVRKWGSVAALFTHSWSVSGGGDATSISAGEYFYTIHLKNAWQIAAQPTWFYDREASEGNRLAFPVGVGVSKTIIPGETPWKLSAQYWYYVASPEEFGPKHQLSFELEAVVRVPLPW